MIKKMLVCLDGSDDSIKALDFAVEMANKIGAEITLLEVVESGRNIPGYYNLSANEDQELATLMAEQKIDKLLPKVAELKTTFDRKIETGHPAEKILEVSENDKYDLVVLGSHGSNALTRFLVGSVSTKVMHHAKVPVLVVR